MRLHSILKTLAVMTVAAAALQAQAQGIYVNKKNGEKVAYPSATFERASTLRVTTSTESYGEGVVATLEYERIADMKTARMWHQAFPSGDGLVVVGGHTTSFHPTPTAEIYQNGQWRELSIGSTHDGAFSVILADGRVMVGGGFSSDYGVGQSKKTDIYAPATQTFTAGPDMSVARALCKAVLMDGKAYVNGNWYADNTVMDCYNGQAFSSVGDMTGLSSPYLFGSKIGSIWTWSMVDNMGKTVAFEKTSSGQNGLPFDEYLSKMGKTDSYLFTALAENIPLNLTPDTRPSDSYSPTLDSYFFLTQNKNGEYWLYRTKIAEDKIGALNLTIPTVFPGTQTAISWRSSVLVNDSREEVYLIGTSGPATNQSVYILSYNYYEAFWTIARAEGFSHNLAEGSWTLLGDGRIACTGGNISDYNDAQKAAYIFTPPVAGLVQSPETEKWGVIVSTKDGKKDTYMEDELESITTYEEQFDERITHEIPQEYLSKMSGYMPIYSGNDVDYVVGTYIMSPNEIVFTSKESTNYYAGKLVADYITQFNHHDPMQNTAMLRTQERTSSGVIASSPYAPAIVVGDGPNFTAFAIVENTDYKGIWTKTAMLLSGTIDDGIRNYYRGIVMLDKSDDTANPKMGIGEFRIFKDKDGYSDHISWPDESRAADNKAKAPGEKALPSAEAAISPLVMEETKIPL